jgi:hypothetical protein
MAPARGSLYTRNHAKGRPADVIGKAVKVMRIATGEEPEDFRRGKDKAAQSLSAAPAL